MQIQWYPGHMAKARRLLTDQLRRVDAVVELCDARLPRSSRNPDLAGIAGNKPRLLVLNKSDLADENATRAWLAAFRSGGAEAMSFSAVRGKPRDVAVRLESLCAERLRRSEERGAKRTLRAMVVGVPNVGKSTFINRINGRPIAETGNKPGVTRANQWIRVTPYLELLDTPGLLWPRLDDREAAVRLAWLGTIRDEILNTEELAVSLLETLLVRSPGTVRERFRLADPPAGGPELLEAVCRGRGFLLPGGVCDTERGAAAVLDEYRAGKLGRLTLETPGKEPPCEKTPPNASGS